MELKCVWTIYTVHQKVWSPSYRLESCFWSLQAQAHPWRYHRGPLCHAATSTELGANPFTTSSLLRCLELQNLAKLPWTYKRKASIPLPPLRFTCPGLACYLGIILSQQWLMIQMLISPSVNWAGPVYGLQGTVASSTIVQYQFLSPELQEGGVCLMFCNKKPIQRVFPK